jgi:hypothetical protein
MSVDGLLPKPYLVTPLRGKYIVVGDEKATSNWTLAWVAHHFCTHCVGTPEKPNYAVACGNCFGCRCFSEGHHPDYLSISKEASGGRISIEQIRSAIQFLSLTAQQASARVIVIWSAEALTLAAANAFLKTLEEPLAESVLILLVTAHPSLLLDTIRSRCFQLRLPTAVTGKTMHACTWTPVDATLLAHCQEALERPEKLCKVADFLSKSMEVKELLYFFLKMGYIIAAIGISKETFPCADLLPRDRDLLAKISEQLSMNVWSWIDRVYETIQSVQQGVSLNMPLLLESLFFYR